MAPVSPVWWGPVSWSLPARGPAGVRTQVRVLAGTAGPASSVRLHVCLFGAPVVIELFKP